MLVPECPKHWLRTRTRKRWKLEGASATKPPVLEFQAPSISYHHRLLARLHRGGGWVSRSLWLHSQRYFLCRRQRSRQAVSPSSKSEVAGGSWRCQWPSMSWSVVDCGFPVTLILVDMWEQVRQPHNKLLIKQEKFQGVTRDGLRGFGLAHLKLQFGSLNIEHPVVVDKIAHKFILGNDFLVQDKCDILNSDSVIVFRNKSIPDTLFRSTINLIFSVICESHGD